MILSRTNLSVCVFAMLWKNNSLNQCYLWKQYIFQGLFLKKGYFDHQIIQTSTLFQQTSTLFTEMWVSIEEIKQNGNGWCKGKYSGFVQKERNFMKNQENGPAIPTCLRTLFTKEVQKSYKSKFPCKAFLLVKVFSFKKTRVAFRTYKQLKNMGNVAFVFDLGQLHYP